MKPDNFAVEQREAEEAVIQEFEREFGLVFADTQPILDLRQGNLAPNHDMLFQLAVRQKLKLRAYQRAVNKAYGELVAINVYGTDWDERVQKARSILAKLGLELEAIQ